MVRSPHNLKYIKKGLIMNCFFLISLILSLQVASTYCYQLFTHPHEVLALVTPYLPEDPIIVEAGAYDGSDSIIISEWWPQGMVHSFEPIPELYKKLSHKTQQSKSIITYQLALGDFVGIGSMYVSEEPWNLGIPSQSSSLLEPKDHLYYASTLFTQKIDVVVKTLDIWAEEKNIDHVDFLWLDMQGYELNTLMASPKIMKTVKAILTEVEFVEAYKDQYLFEDVILWLESQGFVMIAKNDSYGWFGDALFVRSDLI